MSLKDCQLWLKFKSSGDFRNPLTGRKIKEHGPTYNLWEKKCLQLSPEVPLAPRKKKMLNIIFSNHRQSLSDREKLINCQRELKKLKKKILKNERL
jgi:hypothetical protein